MAPVLHLLPHSHLELRPQHNQSAQREILWLLRSRDEQARPQWEITLSTSTLHKLLQALADGNATASSGELQLKVYADVALEKSISSWAVQQLDRHALLFAQPAGTAAVPARGLERAAISNIQRL